MKKAFWMIILSLFLTAPAFADSIVNNSGEVIDGKIVNVSDDMIVIRHNFAEMTVIRTSGQINFDDVIEVKSWILARNSKKLSGKVYFADTENLHIKINPSQSLYIPRYRVKNITIYN